MFKNIWNWILLKVGAIAKMLEKPAEVAVKVVNAIKDYVYNPMVDIFTAMTRTGVDNTVVALIRLHLPGVLSGMLKASNIITDLTKGDISSLLRIFAEYIQSIADEARGKWWAELAARLLPLISGTKIPMPASWAITQGQFLKTIAA